MNILLALEGIRKKHKLTQQMMANIIGVSYTAYQHYEYGQRKTPVILLHRIKNFFNVSVAARRHSDLSYTRTKHKNNLVSKSRLGIGHRLKEIRQQKEIPAKWVAYKMGVSYGYYKSIENSTKIPPRTFYTKFCQVIKVPLNMIRRK